MTSGAIGYVGEGSELTTPASISLILFLLVTKGLIEEKFFATNTTILE